MKRTLLLFLLITSRSLSAISPVQVYGQAETTLYRLAEMVNLGKVSLSFEELLHKEDSLKFTPLQSSNQNIGFTSDNYWVRFSLLNSTQGPLLYYLKTARPITDKVDLYYRDLNGDVRRMQSGDQIPFNSRAFPHRASIFRLRLEPGKTYHMYLNLSSDGEVINLPLDLYSPDAFIQTVYRQQLFYGLFYGLIFLAAIIYLFFFIGLREKSFLNYGMYVLSIALLQLSLDGFIFQYLLPQGGWFNSRLVIFSALVSIFFLGRYSETFLNIRPHFKWLPRLFTAIYITVALMVLGIIISPKILELSYPLANQIGLVLLICIIASIISMRLKGLAVDPFFSIGIGFLILGLVIFILNNLGLIPNNFLTKNGSKIGSGLEVIFLSLSMTNRIRRLKMEQEKSQTIALRKSQEMNDLKNHFMSTMSHELRTPLNAIMGIADEMMKKRGLDDMVRSNFEVVKYASVSLLSSVNDILDFSKIEEGTLKLDLDIFNPLITLEQISANWEIQASEKGLFYVFEADDTIPVSIKGDEARLRQIANNILGNAIKFTSQGNITFSVSAVLEKENCRLILRTKDTGIGIPSEKMDTIFESFNQESMDDKRNFGGLGLGLSIVKKLVDLQQGTIHLKSDVGTGTECLVEIPYAFEQPESPPTHSFDSEEKDLQGAHILVVEDNALNQLIMRKILSGWKNTSFSIVENGQEALETLSKNHFDIILMDLQMPIMDGYEATRQIRAGYHPRYKDLPIIAVTADVTYETKEKVFALGINDYLTKPFQGEILFKKVALLLS